MSIELPDCDPPETLFEDLDAAAWDLCAEIPELDGIYRSGGIDLIHPDQPKTTVRYCESVAVAVIFTLAPALFDSLDWEDEDRRSGAAACYKKIRQA